MNVTKDQYQRSKSISRLADITRYITELDNNVKRYKAEVKDIIKLTVSVELKNGTAFYLPLSTSKDTVAWWIEKLLNSEIDSMNERIEEYKKEMLTLINDLGK